MIKMSPYKISLLKISNKMIRNMVVGVKNLTNSGRELFLPFEAEIKGGEPAILGAAWEQSKRARLGSGAEEKESRQPVSSELSGARLLAL